MGQSSSNSSKPLTVGSETKSAATISAAATAPAAATVPPCKLTAAEKRVRTESECAETLAPKNSAVKAISGADQAASSQTITRAMSLPANLPSEDMTGAETTEGGSVKQQPGWLHNMTEEHWERLNMMCIVTPTSL